MYMPELVLGVQSKVTEPGNELSHSQKRNCFETEWVWGVEPKGLKPFESVGPCCSTSNHLLLL